MSKKIIYKTLIVCILMISLSNIYALSTNMFKKVKVGNVQVETQNNNKERESIKKEVYDINIDWEGMQFAFNENQSMEWNNQKNEFELKKSSEFISNSSDINITNSSNKTITVKFKYISLEKFRSVKGSFNKDEIELRANKGENVSFTLNGKMPDVESGYILVGNIIITII